MGQTLWHFLIRMEMSQNYSRLYYVEVKFGTSRAVAEPHTFEGVATASPEFYKFEPIST